MLKKQSLTTEGFIEKAKNGDKYNYSKVKYINNHLQKLLLDVMNMVNLNKEANHLRGHGLSYILY